MSSRKVVVRKGNQGRSVPQWKKLTKADVSQIKVRCAIPDHIDVPGRGSGLRNRRGCGIMWA